MSITEKQQNTILYTALALVVSAILIVYFKIIKPALDKSKDAGNAAADPFLNDDVRKEQLKKATESLKTIAAPAQKYERVGSSIATKTASEWNVIANSIHTFSKGIQIGKGGTAEDKMAYEVCRVKNDADWKILQREYGERVSAILFGISFGEKNNLQTLCKKYFTDAKIAAVNKNFQSKGMTGRL